LPYLLGALLFRNRLRVQVPLCNAHQHHFHWQVGILWGGLAGLAALLFGCFALIPHVPDAILSRCFTVVGGAAALWIVAYLVNRLTGIMPATVSEHDAVIVGVSERFARAYEAVREEPRDSRS
jgi:hypothetical protein